MAKTGARKPARKPLAKPRLVKIHDLRNMEIFRCDGEDLLPTWAITPFHEAACQVEPSGRRRYLDASWRRRDGRLIVAEVDGALHMLVKQWWDDQLRQNELALADALVLRYPTVVVRSEETLVAEQLRRGLWL